MSKPEVIKADNDYPCKECGGHGVPRVKNGTHYIQCYKCPAKTRFCLNGESEARYEWAGMNQAKQALKNDYSGQIIPLSCVECLKPIIGPYRLDKANPLVEIIYCKGCGEPIHEFCSCSNCNL